jgi:hypothetical protein
MVFWSSEQVVAELELDACRQGAERNKRRPVDYGYARHLHCTQSSRKPKNTTRFLSKVASPSLPLVQEACSHLTRPLRTLPRRLIAFGPVFHLSYSQHLDAMGVY